MLIPALALFTLLLAAHISVAQEVIDPRSGRLLLTVTDIVVNAGLVPAVLDLLRPLPGPADLASAFLLWRAE